MTDQRDSETGREPICIFAGTGVICGRKAKENCYRCGFNPTVLDKRLEELCERRPELRWEK